jgi:hypothetical protein
MPNENEIQQRPIAMVEMRPLLGPTECRVNITYSGLNGDLPDPVSFDAVDSDVKQWVTEALRTGGIPGIPIQPAADLADFVIDRFSATNVSPFNRMMIRPKTPFGMTR